MVELTGRVTYRERIALPTAAEIHVELLAVDACKTVAEVTQVTDGAQVPISFVLSYPADAVDELLGYALRAEIRYDGRVAFVTSDPIPVITQGHRSRDVEIRVQMAASAADLPAGRADRLLPGDQKLREATGAGPAGA